MYKKYDNKMQFVRSYMFSRKTEGLEVYCTVKIDNLILTRFGLSRQKSNLLFDNLLDLTSLLKSLDA